MSDQCATQAWALAVLPYAAIHVTATCMLDLIYMFKGRPWQHAGRRVSVEGGVATKSKVLLPCLVAVYPMLCQPFMIMWCNC